MKQCIVMTQTEHLQAISEFGAKNGIQIPTSDMSISMLDNGDVVIDVISTAIGEVTDTSNKEKDKPKRIRRSKEQIEAGMPVEAVAAGQTLEEWLAENGKSTEDNSTKENTVGDLVEENAEGDIKEEPATDLSNLSDDSSESPTVEDSEALFG